jgi:uncharacterized protein YcbX
MHLSALFVYPVKSLRGFAVDSAEVDALGVVGDRRFMLVDETGRFLTQRALPQMARIATALERDSLTLSAEGAGRIRVSRRSGTPDVERSVMIWKSTGLLADDCGDAPAAWLSDFLKTKCRLVRIGEKFMRPILKPEIAGPGEVVNFADAFPFLVVSEASLADLNDRLAARHEETLAMNRFRPNLVVTGSDAFAEDTWPRLRIGHITFRAGGPCGRCAITTTDQFTGERGVEPLRTLATYRRDAKDSTDVNFGQNLIHETKTGALRVGDEVHLL